MIEHPLQNLAQAEVMAYFLLKEVDRHREDINKIDHDLCDLITKHGVDIKKISERVRAGDWIAP